MKIYNGFDCRDYESASHIESLIRKDGYKNVHVDPKGVNKIHPDPELQVVRNACVEWGFRKILEKIVESKEPTLVLENDAFFEFEEFTYERLKEHWEKLGDGTTIKVAMLFYYGKHKSIPVRRDLEKIDDFWAAGSHSLGQVANIYTPEGASFLLERDRFFPSIETYLGLNPDMVGLYTADRNQVSQDFYANFDTDGLGQKNPVFWFNHYKGEQL